MEKYTMEFKAGETYYMKNGPKVFKVHVMYVLDSVYEDYKLIVFKYYSYKKQYWVEQMYNSWRFEMHVKSAEEYKKNNK